MNYLTTKISFLGPTPKIEKKGGRDGSDSVSKHNAHINAGSGGGAGGIFFSSSLGILYFLRRLKDKDTFLQIENTNIQIQKYKNTLMKIRNTNNNMTTIDRNYRMARGKNNGYLH